MRPKKILTKAQQLKMTAGRIAASKRRLEIRISEESKQDALEALDDISEGIKVQLEVVKDDVITIQRMVTALDRATLREEWGKVASISTAIQAFSMGISRRIETCSTQARVANKILAAIRVK